MKMLILTVFGIREASPVVPGGPWRLPDNL